MTFFDIPKNSKARRSDFALGAIHKLRHLVWGGGMSAEDDIIFFSTEIPKYYHKNNPSTVNNFLTPLPPVPHPHKKKNREILSFKKSAPIYLCAFIKYILKISISACHSSCVCKYIPTRDHKFDSIDYDFIFFHHEIVSTINI